MSIILAHIFAHCPKAAIASLLCGKFHFSFLEGVLAMQQARTCTSHWMNTEMEGRQEGRKTPSLLTCSLSQCLLINACKCCSHCIFSFSYKGVLWFKAILEGFLCHQGSSLKITEAAQTRTPLFRSMVTMKRYLKGSTGCDLMLVMCGQYHCITVLLWWLTLIIVPKRQTADYTLISRGAQHRQSSWTWLIKCLFNHTLSCFFEYETENKMLVSLLLKYKYYSL